MIKDGYSICYNKWVLDTRIKNELPLLLIISSLCAKTGECFANNSYFSSLFNCTEVSVSQKINKLVKCGYLSVEYEKRGAEIKKRVLRLKTFLTDDSNIFYPTIKNIFKDNNISISNINNKKEIYKEKFEEWWREYPKKVSKLGAMKAFEKVLANKSATFEDILSGVKRYAWHCRVQKTEDQYIKHPATWLNQGCWIDVYNDRPSDEEYATWKFKPKNPETETDWDFWRVMNEDEKNG